MKPKLLFSLASNVAIIPWILMVFVPRWKGTRWVVNSLLFVVAFAAAYVTRLFATFSLENFAGGGLAEIRELFADDYALLAGWLHYLAFDLFVGTWVFNDSKKRGIHHLLVAPCLFFTLMTGPFGLLPYLVIRYFKVGHWIVNDNFHPV